MLLTQKNASFLIGTISLVIAYFVVITIANCFKAWCAHKMGDDTPADFGFLSLNPLIHLDPIGLMLIPLLQFGWGRHVPINPLNIHGKWRKAKTAFAFLADSLAYVLVSIVALVALILIFDHHIIDITRFMILHRALSYLTIATAYPLHSSILISIGFILIGIMYLSVILSVLQGIINAVYLGALFIANRSPHMVIDRSTILLVLIFLFVLLPLSGILDVVGLLRTLVVQVITHGGYVIAHLLGRV